MESIILTLLIFVPVIGAIVMLPFAKLYGNNNSEIILNTKYNNNNVFEMRFDKIINKLKK